MLLPKILAIFKMHLKLSDCITFDMAVTLFKLILFRVFVSQPVKTRIIHYTLGVHTLPQTDFQPLFRVNRLQIICPPLPQRAQKLLMLSHRHPKLHSEQLWHNLNCWVRRWNFSSVILCHWQKIKDDSISRQLFSRGRKRFSVAKPEL